MFRFIYQCMLGQKKLYLIMLFVLTALATIELYFAGIYTVFMELEGSSAFIIRTLATFISFFSCFFTLFINQFFLESKTEEISILMITGGSFKRNLSYICIQFGIFYLVTTLLSLPLGISALTLTSGIIETTLQTQVSISISTLMMIFGSFIVMKLIFLLFLNISFFNRVEMSIYKYMTGVSKSDKPANDFTSQLPSLGKPKKPYGSVFIVLFTILLLINGITGLVDLQSPMNTLLFHVCMLLVSFLLIINKWIPLLFKLFHDRYFMNHPFLLFTISHLKETMQVIGTMVNMNAIFIPIILSLFIIPIFEADYSSFLLICYIALLSMIILGFFIRFHVYLPTKSRDIATLQALGYRDKFIINMQKLEVFIFILFTFLLPFLCFSIVLYQGWYQGIIEMSTISIIGSVYLGFYSLFSVHMYVSYMKQTREVLQDVRYLNRGE